MSTELEQRAVKLREVVNAPTEKERAVRELMEVEAQIAAQQKQEALDAAKARMIGIKRAHGSLRDTYREDADRVRTATRELNDAAEKMNARYAQLVELEDEARRLNKTSGVPSPEFTNPKSSDRVQPPAVTIGTVEKTRLIDSTDIARIARAAAVGRAQEEVTGIVQPEEPREPTRSRPKISEREMRGAMRGKGLGNVSY